MSRHRYVCQVRFSDVDVYGHVNNVKYFEFYQEARIAFLLSLPREGDPGADEGADQGADDGVPGVDAGSSLRQVVARIEVDYRRPILFRPEPYVVETWVTRVGTSSYDLGCRIVDEDDTVYSVAGVVLVAYDTRTGRSRRLTDTERSRLETARQEVS